MDNLDILGVGNALVDETFYIEEDLVRKTNLNFNQFKQISYSEQQEIKSFLGNQDPEIVCGGSTTNSLVAASNFGSKCGHICQLGRPRLRGEHQLADADFVVPTRMANEANRPHAPGEERSQTTQNEFCERLQLPEKIQEKHEEEAEMIFAKGLEDSNLLGHNLTDVLSIKFFIKISKLINGLKGLAEEIRLYREKENIVQAARREWFADVYYADEESKVDCSV